MEKNFTVKFRGVRGSYPTPVRNFLHYGGNTSCVEVVAGDRLIILDAGTGIIELGKELMQSFILSAEDFASRKPISAVLLLSHIHQDHIQGLPFFNPAYVPSTKLDIYGLSAGKKTLRDNLSAVLFDKVFPLGLEDVNCELGIFDFVSTSVLVLKQSGENILLNSNTVTSYVKEEDDVVIRAHKTFAHPKNGSLCYKIEFNNKTLIYATDKETYMGSDKKFVEFAHGADLLIHDAQYTNQEYISSISPKQGFGHSTHQMAEETAKLAKAKRLAFFHFDPNHNDEFLSQIEAEYSAKNSHYFFAKENLEIVL